MKAHYKRKKSSVVFFSMQRDWGGPWNQRKRIVSKPKKQNGVNHPDWFRFVTSATPHSTIPTLTAMLSEVFGALLRNFNHSIAGIHHVLFNAMHLVTKNKCQLSSPLANSFSMMLFSACSTACVHFIWLVLQLVSPPPVWRHYVSGQPFCVAPVFFSISLFLCPVTHTQHWHFFIRNASPCETPTPHYWGSAEHYPEPPPQGAYLSLNSFTLNR